MNPPALPDDAVLVTGSSTGLGLETALHLASRGFNVFAGLRDPGRSGELLQLAASRGVRLNVLPLDITSTASIDAALDSLLSRTDKIYGLVNNAGTGLRGCLEDLDMSEVRAVFEANVFGTFAITKRVLPSMRSARRGRIVTISSVGGRIATFGLSAYCATKFALEAFGEALNLEIEPFGLRSILVEPGIVNTTRWTVNRGLAKNACQAASPYHSMFSRAEDIAGHLAKRSKTSAGDVAEAVHRALTARNPSLRYIVGRPASTVIALRRYLPNSVFERLYFGSFLRQLRPSGDRA